MKMTEIKREELVKIDGGKSSINPTVKKEIFKNRTKKKIKKGNLFDRDFFRNPPIIIDPPKEKERI